MLEGLRLKRLAPRTIRGVRAVLRAALADAVRWGSVVRNAAALAHGPRVTRPELRVLSREEAKAFLEIRETAWLFTRGSESVRLVREENSNGCCLFLYGPATKIVTHEFADLTERMKRQAEIEVNLLAAGYQLAQSSSERRSEHRTRNGQDHRRAS